MARKASFSRDYLKFCRLLREARNASGLTQLQLAQRLHKPQSYVSKYELGERRLDIIEFLKICKSLSLNPIIIIDSLA